MTDTEQIILTSQRKPKQLKNPYKKIIEKAQYQSCFYLSRLTKKVKKFQF